MNSNGAIGTQPLMIELSVNHSVKHSRRVLSLSWDPVCSVINGRGRAPLIVVSDTGTRPQTKPDRVGAGCHAQSPPRKPACCSGRFAKERSQDTQ